jgi:hypothetical protein
MSALLMTEIIIITEVDFTCAGKEPSWCVIPAALAPGKSISDDKLICVNIILCFNSHNINTRSLFRNG